MTAASLPAGRTTRLGRRSALCALAAVALVAIMLLALGDNRINFAARNALPLDKGTLLGADQLGRSLLRQVARACTITVLLGGAASIVSVTLGFLLGFANLSPHPLVRGAVTVLVDIKSGLPTFFVALLLGAMFGQTPLFLFLVLCVVGVEFSARATRDSGRPFVEGAMYRSMVAEGVPVRRRFVHLLLFLSPMLLPLWALVLLETILVESGLSFVGLGLRPELASLGVLIREYYRIMLQNGWPIMLATTVLGGACVGLFQLARRQTG